MGESWVVLLAWGAVYSAGGIPAGLAGRWESLPQDVPAVRQWFEREQLVSPCEPAYGMSHLAERWKKYRHLPRVDVLGNYPSLSWFEGEIQFARNHIKWLDGQAAMDVRGLYSRERDECRSETLALIELYQSFIYARNCLSLSKQPPCWGYIITARDHLGDIEKELGTGALERGALPPVVPLWRFRRVR